MQIAMKVLDGWLSHRYNKDAWRMRSWTQDDYVQEGYAVYLAMERHYSNITQAAHLMALFKTTWWRYLNDQSKKEIFVTQTALSTIVDQQGQPDDEKLRYRYDRNATLTQEIADEPLDLSDIAWRAERLSEDAQILLAVLTAPSEVVAAAVQGIVFTQAAIKSLSSYLSWSPIRIRKAAVELVEELSMPSPVQLLATVTGLKVKDKEDRQAYLIRLVEAVAALPDDAWNKLPQSAQDYYNSAAAAVNSVSPVPDLPDESAPAQRPPSEAKKAQEARRLSAVPTPPVGKKTSTETSSPAASPALPEEQAAEPVTIVSPTQRARELMLLNEAMTPLEVRDQLKAENFPLPANSALQAMRSDIRACLKLLKKHGMLVQTDAR